MWLIALKGLAGSGKSTLAQALSQQLRWPLIDKDDIRDLLDDRQPGMGPLAYEIMFRLARCQLLQGLSVICDSPLTGSIAYEHAQTIAQETQAHLGIIECHCSDESMWSQRIDGRKALNLPAHHQTDWTAFQAFRHQTQLHEPTSIACPHLVLDTAQPLPACLASALTWLEQQDTIFSA